MARKDRKPARSTPGPDATKKSGAGTRGASARGGRRDEDPLLQRQIEAIRTLAVDIAEKNHGPGMVLICNKATEPSPLSPTELLDDTCAWCKVPIYYDRKMPSPIDITRVCIPCGLLLLEAEKKGAN